MVLQKILRKIRREERQIRILILGIDNAGKTTLVKQLNGDDVNTVSPTLGFKITTFQYDKYTLNLWDVGGQKSLRTYWKNYFESTDGLVWVVDCADTLRIEMCKRELHDLLKEERLAGATLLVSANKQDLPGAVTSDQLTTMLELPSIKTHHWKIFPVCALTGDNLINSIDWLISDIGNRIYHHA
ncbi:ADP-ribosylation factor-like protein 2, partial [Fragariocoptes setiger]